MTKLSTARISLLTSCLLASIYASNAFACAAQGCASDTTTNVTINFSGSGLDDLNNLSGVVVAPISQVNSGNVSSVSSVYAPVADTLNVTSTAIGNVVALNLDQQATVIANQFNSGNVTSLSSVTDVGSVGRIKDSIVLSSVAIGNVFNASLNLNDTGASNKLGAIVAQSNTGSISSMASYARVDPVSINVTSTAIGNVASIAHTGMNITVK